MCKECIDNDQSTCIPQWGATKPSKACTFCAGKKKSCTATVAWANMVEMLKPFGGRIGVYIESSPFSYTINCTSTAALQGLDGTTAKGTS